MSKSSDARIRLLVCVFLVLLTAGVYCRVVGFGFVSLDDKFYVSGNRHVLGGLTKQGVEWAFTTSCAANWHPITWISHMLDVQLYGTHPWGYHLTNLLFHLMNTVLLFLLLSRITGKMWRSAFVAALFALHPLHVESVAWISERKDVLSTFFWILTMWAYAAYASRPALKRYLLMLAVFALGLMSKPMLVTLPIVLLLMDYWPLQRVNAKMNWRRLVIEKVPLFALTVASCVITLIVQQKGGAVRTIDQYSLGVRAANALASYTIYIWKMIWPRGLCAIYPHPGNTLPVMQVAISALLLTAVTFFLVRAGKKYPYASVGWFWYLITLVPVIGLVQVGQQAMADRYTYAPLVGLFVLIAWGIPDLLRKWSAARYALAGGAAVIIVALAVTTYAQTGCWRNGTTLFGQALSATGGHYMVRCCVAQNLIEQGKPREAVEQLNQALKMKPDLAEAHNALGFVLFRQRKPTEAIREFSRALEINPNLASAHSNLGNALVIQGKIDEGISHIRKAIEAKSNYAEAYYNLGNALARQGDMDGAVPEYQQALKYDPDLAEAHCSLGAALLQQNEVSEAEEHLSEALEINPKLAQAHYAMTVALFRDGDIDGAREEMRLARKLGCQIDPRLAQALSGK